jgi:putative RecB family exonuclease
VSGPDKTPQPISLFDEIISMETQEGALEPALVEAVQATAPKPAPKKVDPLDEETGPRAYMDKDGLHITSDAVSTKLEKSSLSPSTITGLLDCSARWLGEKHVMRGKAMDSVPAKRGSMFHKVMEDFFDLEPEQRTQSKMRETVDQVTSEGEFAEFASDPEHLLWLRDAVNGYYSMGAKPERIKVATIKDDKGRDRKGLEVFVKGRIGNTSRDTLGFIDRLIENTKRGDGSIVIEDYKSGSKAHVWKAHTKGTEGLPEARQQAIYAILLRQRGYEVSSARLIYPVARKIVTAPVNDDDFMDLVVSNVEEADKALNTQIENNTFETSPSYICAWCPLSKICPSATIKPYDKMKAAYAEQPEPEELAEYIEF